MSAFTHMKFENNFHSIHVMATKKVYIKQHFKGEPSVNSYIWTFIFIHFSFIPINHLLLLCVRAIIIIIRVVLGSSIY